MALPLECLDNGLDNSGGGALWASRPGLILGAPAVHPHGHCVDVTAKLLGNFLPSVFLLQKERDGTSLSKAKPPHWKFFMRRGKSEVVQEKSVLRESFLTDDTGVSLILVPFWVSENFTHPSAVFN